MNTDESESAGSVEVLSLLPFWRYAVGPTSRCSPAIPYWSLALALAFYEQAKRELPWAGVILYRRRWFRGIEVARKYIPSFQ
jgi:hypothetical protein